MVMDAHPSCVLLILTSMVLSAFVLISNSNANLGNILMEQNVYIIPHNAPYRPNGISPSASQLHAQQVTTKKMANVDPSLNYALLRQYGLNHKKNVNARMTALPEHSKMGTDASHIKNVNLVRSGILTESCACAPSTLFGMVRNA